MTSMTWKMVTSMSRGSEPKKSTPGKPIGKPSPPGKTVAKTTKKAVAKVAAPKPISEETREFYGNVLNVRKHFDPERLKITCEAHESTFGETYGMERVEVDQKEPSNYYYYKDNGSDILAVAHLDTVISHERRITNFAETADGLVVHSGALDDRLGAYIILELLPSMGVEFDWLLTVGEESGKSTAKFFDPPDGKEYNWGIEFDRGETDVVMYCYDDPATDKLVRGSGARTGRGSFSDIAYLEHLEVKMFNWGVAYQDYHGPRGYAYLEDTFDMVAYFLRFHRLNADEYLPHEKKKYNPKSRDHKPTRWQGSSPNLYGHWVDNKWVSYTDAERKKRREEAEAESKTDYWAGGSGKGGGSKSASERADEYWSTQSSLYEEGSDYDLYEPQKALGGHEELDEETRAILKQFNDELDADDFTDLELHKAITSTFDIDPENPLGVDSLFDEDPDFVGPPPSAVGGWPTDD